MENKFGNDTLEFRQIVLKHIQRILEISSSELRNKTLVKNHGNYSETIENEDTRKSYMQAIENLSYVLIPYFDEEMFKIYEVCINVINGYTFQLQKKFQKEINLIYEEKGEDSINIKLYCLDKKIEYSKKLFVALNKLLHRNDYLKTAVYGEDSDELVNEEEGDSEE